MVFTPALRPGAGFLDEAHLGGEIPVRRVVEPERSLPLGIGPVLLDGEDRLRRRRSSGAFDPVLADFHGIVETALDRQGELRILASHPDFRGRYPENPFRRGRFLFRFPTGRKEQQRQEEKHPSFHTASFFCSLCKYRTETGPQGESNRQLRFKYCQ